MKEPPLTHTGVSLRAIVIGVVLAVANAYWLAVTSELMEPQCLLTFVSLFFNAVFTLFALVTLNGLFKQIFPRHALSVQELLVIYIMIVMVGTVGGHTTMTFLVGTLAHPFRFASPENEWAELFWRFIPSWFTPPPSVLDGYFEGDSSFYVWEHVRGWLTPIFVWTVFIAIIWFILICMNVIIRAQWTEREKLAYPIIQLPLQMATGGRSFWQHGGMWLGFGVAGFFELLAGLHYLFPVVPAVQLNYFSISHLFSDEPWNSIGWISLSAFPFIIGLTFFVPLDISLSAWVFYLLGKAERVVRLGMLGESELHFSERAGGAWLAVGLLALWGTRRHLQDIARKVWRRDAPIDDSHEAMRYRTAVAGLIFGLLLLTSFSYKAGMTLAAIGGFILIYFVMGMGVNRVRAEFGPPSHEILALDPEQIMVYTVGTRRLGAANLTVLSFYYWLNRLNVSHPMPNQLEAFKIAERTRISPRRLVWVMMFATIVGTLASFWAYLHIMYRAGADSVSGYIVGIGWETFGYRLERWLVNPRGPDLGGLQAMGGGATITFLLYFLRHRFFWWPFHPIGYVMTAATWGGLADYWFSVFLGWAIKAVIVKHFGLGAHRRAVPFFLGLVLGDYVVSSGWSLVGTIWRIPTYVLWSP